MSRRSLLILLALIAGPLFAQTESITAAEYFFDDAGTAEGAGMPLTVTSATDPLASAMASIDVSALSPGPHVLYLRFQDDAGTWGNVIGQPFVVPASFGVVDIAGGEFFFDSDPGQGSGMAITGAGTLPLKTFDATADVTGTGAGAHAIGLRVQDDRGEWSADLFQPFVGRAAADYRINRVVSAEYFFDTDPGLDLASPLLLMALDPQPVAAEGTDTVDVFALSQTFHTLSARVADDFGMFSFDITQSLNTRDLDGDTFIDLVDAFPLDMNEWRDTDVDGIGNNSDDDIDGDGTLNDADTDDDGDGIPDVDESRIGLDPIDHVDGLFDIDRDGLTGLEEFVLGTDPNNPDTDGDSVVDGSDPTPGTLGVLDQVPTPGGIDSGDLFGASVAISGNLFVAGAPQDEGGGTVHVFRLEGATPVSDGSLTIPDGFMAEEFGRSVAAEGDTVVVGAPGTPTAAKGPAPLEALQAAIFQRLSDGTWSFKAALKGANPNGEDKFGAAVAIDGSRIVIGAPDDAEDETTGAGSGAVYVYDFAGDTVTLSNKVKPPAPTAGEQFGMAVAAANGKFAVGSPNAMMGNDPTGVVSVFQQVGSNLSSLGTVTGSQTGSGGTFGASISMSGDRVAVGAPGESSDEGAVYLYNTGGGNVSETMRVAADDAGAGDGFGAAVSLDGDTLAVGSPGNSAVGSLYRYSPQGVLRNKFAAVAGQARFGSAVGVSGDRILIGAPQTTNSQGAVALQRDVRVLFKGGFE